MKPWRAWKLPLMAILSVIVLTSCGKPESGNKAAEADVNPSVQTPAELVFYSNNGNTEDSFNQLYGDPLRKKFPHFTIKYIQATTGTGTGTIEQMLVSGINFDLYYHTSGNFERYLQENGLQVDISDLIKKHKVDLTQIEPQIINSLKQNTGGKQYGLPVNNQTMVLYYNKAIFQKFGVPFPKDGMLWSEVLELEKRISRNDEGKSYMGLSVNPANIMNQNQFSLPSVDPKTAKPIIQTNENWKKLFDTLFVQPYRTAGVQAEIKRIKKVPDHYTFVRDQNLAMYGYSSGLMAALTDELQKVDFDIVSLPTFSELPGVGSQPYPVIFGITSLSKQQDAAMQALQYLISDEYQKSISIKGTIPVSTKEAIRSVFGSESVFKDKHLSSVFFNKSAPIAPIQPYSSAVDKIYAARALSVAQGDGDLNSLFRSAEEEAQKAIDSYKK